MSNKIESLSIPKGWEHVPSSAEIIKCSDHAKISIFERIRNVFFNIITLGLYHDAQCANLVSAIQNRNPEGIKYALHHGGNVSPSDLDNLASRSYIKSYCKTWLCQKTPCNGTDVGCNNIGDKEL